MLVLIILTTGYGVYAFGLIGTPKPKNLGINYTEADWQTSQGKSQIKTEIVAATVPLEAIKYQGSHPVTQSFTSQELTAEANKRTWQYLPFKNIQIRINQDGSTEVSGNLNTSIVTEYLTAVGGLSLKEAEIVKSYVPIQGMPTFYLKGAGSVENNKISLNLQSVQVGPVSIPTGYINQYQSTVVTFLNDRLQKWDGVKIDSLNFNSSQLNFSGTLPNTEIVAK